VIPDDARAEIFFRLVDSGDTPRAATEEAVQVRGSEVRIEHPGRAAGFDGGL
jgi:hypothetical protein